jgi:hypothetical protein
MDGCTKTAGEGYDSGMARCAESRRVLRQLDEELAAASQATGRTLVWTAADRELLTLIADTIDRKNELHREYKNAGETSRRMRLSAEMRLLEGSLARLLKMVHTDIPQPESQTTLKARHASRVRWDRERASG